MSLDQYMQDGQDPKVVEKIYVKIQDMLTTGEAIKYIAIQKKPAVTLLPDCIVISNRRIYLCEFTKLGLSTNFEIFSWKDIKDIAFKEEIFGSKVTVIPFTGENLSIDYIPKTQARKLFHFIKDALESSKNEKTETPVQEVKITTKPVIPVRDIYGSQLESKDINPIKPVESAHNYQAENQITETKVEIVTPFIPAVENPKPEVEDELTLKLKKLKSLYDKQLITQAEYESKKAEILEQL